MSPPEEIHALLETTLGSIRVRLFPADAPKTVENFIALASGTKEWLDPRTGTKSKKPLYDGTIFHLVVPEFMIQGGDPLGKGTGGPGYKFGDEFQSGRRFDRPGYLAMANSGRNTNGSQFFLTELAAPWLNGKYTIFGEVVDGLEVVRAIARCPTGPKNRPVVDVVLQKLTIQKTKS